MREDTIIALSTPPGYGGLGIVRLSGPRALAIAKKIFKPKKKTDRLPPRCPVLGRVFDPAKKESFEEAMLTFFPAPRSYTCEDIVEISCHSSPVILKEVIRLGMAAGARHSDPGEFTLRAYLHGRIDILQAEAVNDLIHASSLTQARISLRQLEGSLSRNIQALRGRIIQFLSSIEASIEFPDEALDIRSTATREILKEATLSVQDLVDSYESGRPYTEGLTVVLAGRTNVGKSTLFNTLLGRERAIVTASPGTTRDYLQEKIRIHDALFTLTDMAGWNRTTQPVEKKGIAKGKQLALHADCVLILLDSSQRETEEDLKLLKKTAGKQRIILFNKADLPRRMDTHSILKKNPGIPSLEISALKGKNIPKLKEILHTTFAPAPERFKDLILHMRQNLLLGDILASLREATRLLQEGFPEEIVAEEVRKTLPWIGELTGEIQSEDIIRAVFSRFCVGK